MVGIKSLTSQKVVASSILEVVVSMVIILMVLGISLTIYSNVVRQSMSARRLKAEFILRQALIQFKHEGDGIKTLDFDNWQVEQEVSAYEVNTPLWLVHLTVYDEDHQQVAETRQIINSDNHD